MVPEEIIQKIHNAQTSRELEEMVFSLLVEDISKPGLVILPVGGTYEAGIYPRLNQELLEREDIIHPELYLSHLDELIIEESSNGEKTSIKSFSETLEASLSNLCPKLGDRFYKIDTEDLNSFQHFINIRAGARAIYLGLGENPESAHVAFIGEEYVNREIVEVELTESCAEKLGVTKAVTVGTDIFSSAGLERIVLTISGAHKVASFMAAIENIDTGLGYLLEHHLDKLGIYCDHEFAAEFKKKL
ncbi:MAG: hypothetical protein MK033_04200 [Candidatus Caenarcaniphilales bacterium]|nr:hypothetical protein [Candidatus Caenarcaniphilales bacterium]